MIRAFLRVRQIVQEVLSLNFETNLNKKANGSILLKESYIKNRTAGE